MGRPAIFSTSPDAGYMLPSGASFAHRREKSIMKRYSKWFGLYAGLIALAFQAVASAQISETVKAQFGLPAQYAATAFGQAGSTAGKSFGLTVSIDNLTDDNSVQALADALLQKGQDGLVDALESMKGIGRVAPTGSVGTQVEFVRIRPTKDGGQHIVLVANRPISFPELFNGTRSTDYKFGIVMLNLDKDGKGTGIFAPLCKIKFNKKKELEIENYGQKPFRLANVYRQK
jgi:hypothetical protein